MAIDRLKFEEHWRAFVRRAEATCPFGAVENLTFPYSLFLAQSVARFALGPAVSAPGRHALVASLWQRAACAINAELLQREGEEAMTALLALRDALDFTPLDGATGRLMAGLEALAAVAAETGGVKDGFAIAFAAWLASLPGAVGPLQDEVGAMHLVAWALHEAGLHWTGSRAGLIQLRSDVGRTCDRLLFQAPSDQALEALAAVSACEQPVQRHDLLLPERFQKSNES